MSKTRNDRGQFCPYAKKCGACQLRNMTYREQLSWKMAKTIKLLGSFGHVDEIIGMEDPRHYRCKVQAAFGTARSGKMISGIYRSGTHSIVALDECETEDPTADRIIVEIRKLASAFKLTTYNEDTHNGFLRHVLIRVGKNTGQVLVTLVTGTQIFPGKNSFIKKLVMKCPEITSVVQNINSGSTSMVLGEKQKVLYGNGYIEDELCGCRFRISSKSFYQINPIQTEILYDTAMRFANLSAEDTVIDAYCGIGTIALVAAKYGCRVTGVELNPDAVKDANCNKKLNNADNAEFVCADAGEFMKETAAEGMSADVLFMDPPRSGSTVTFLHSAVSMQPAKIVYISCNPETQARDLLFLTKNGYRVKKIQPVDMFPHTEHVESVVLLSKGHFKSTIDK